MAKYTVDYACGHGSREMALYGKHSERERKIEWMERAVMCPACNKAKHLAADDAAPRKATIRINSVPMQVVVVLSGQIDANLSLLREHGWDWSDAPIGALGLFEAKAEWRFVRCWAYHDDASIRAALAEIPAALAEIGWDLEKTLDSADVAMAVEAIRVAEATRVEREAAVTACPKPTRPAWYAAKATADGTIKCNRTIYGGRAKSIYVNGERVAVTQDQIAEIEAYWRQLDAHKAAAKGA